MTMRREIVCLVAAACFSVSMTGCQMLHNLQLHRLWKLNHGAAGMPPEDYQTRNDAGPTSPSAYFASVNDEAAVSQPVRPAD